MRARSIHDKESNSYRYQRAEKRRREQEEKQASNRIWNKIYDKIQVDPDKKSSG